MSDLKALIDHYGLVNWFSDCLPRRPKAARRKVRQDFLICVHLRYSAGRIEPMTLLR
jgi:hypothetical protein